MRRILGGQRLKVHLVPDWKYVHCRFDRDVLALPRHILIAWLFPQESGSHHHTLHLGVEGISTLQ